MTQEEKEFMNANIKNWQTVQAGYVRNLDKPIVDKYVEIYKKYINANYVYTAWCGGCRFDLIYRLYSYFLSMDVQTSVEVKEVQFITEGSTKMEPKDPTLETMAPPPPKPPKKKHNANKRM